MITSGNAGGLEYDLSLPEGGAGGATVAILLHGRGSHKGDLQALRPVLPGSWALVTPQAPYPGPEWGYGPGWAWYRHVEEDRVVPETLDGSLELLDGFLGALPKVLRFAPERIVMGGFSQGGTMSLAYALSRPGTLTAAFNFSGFLADSVELPDTSSATETPPVFWGHGVQDPNIPIGLAEKGRARLDQAGLRLVAKDYPIGHWMLPDEVHAAVAMVEGGD